jgi:hypothetical protein
MTATTGSGDDSGMPPTSGTGDDGGGDASTADDTGTAGSGAGSSGAAGSGSVTTGPGMYDLVYVAHGNGGEHVGYNFYGVVVDVTNSMTGQLVGQVQGQLDTGRWNSFTWPKILQDGHKYVMGMFADKAMTCTPGAISNGMTGGGGGQWLFPIPAPGTIAVGTGFPKAGPAPVTDGKGGGVSTGVITAAIVKASEMGDPNPDGSYYMYRFSSAPAPNREASCMYFPNSMGTAKLLPPCGGGSMCHP